MKNIHVLPTSQPSNLLLCIKSYIEHKDTPAENSDNKGNFRLGFGIYANKVFYQHQHIYITSTEEIKEGDWCYNSITNKIYRKLKGNFAFAYEYQIILTTDGDLIKESVQAIDDEFLGWFVKNPSCENVEVSEDYFKPSNMVYGHDTEPYKIIIPKEEQKQHLVDMMKSDEELGLYEEPKTKCYCGHTTYCDCGPEQDFKDIELPQQERPETLEEVAERFYGEEEVVNDYDISGYLQSAFLTGAKWQQERSYSEEDIREAFLAGVEKESYKGLNFDDWFEKFKK
jgi:hypothetical protein